MENLFAIRSFRPQAPTLHTTEQRQELAAPSSLKPPIIFRRKPAKTKPYEQPFVQHRLVHLSKQGRLRDAVEFLDSAVRNGHRIKRSTYSFMLQACIDMNSITEGRKVHAHIDSSFAFDRDTFIRTKLVSMYARCGDLEEARKVFDEMYDRNIFTWSAMIGGYGREELWGAVVELFVRMVHEGVTTDAFLLPKVLQACGNLGLEGMGKSIHSMAIKMGFDGLTHICNSLMAVYWKSGNLRASRRLFDLMTRRDCVSWNSIISGHCELGLNREALELFDQMQLEGIEPSSMTWNILIAGYSQCGNCDFAMKLMQRMKSCNVEPDVFTWTTMISGSSQNNRGKEALDLFTEMQSTGVNPNGMTIVSALSACADIKDLKNGIGLHSMGIKLGAVENLLVVNALIDMYAKCGKLDASRTIFDSVVERDIFTWNSMISGYTQAGFSGMAYDLFCQLSSSSIRRNAVTWNIMISGYMKSGDEEQALELFHEMEKTDYVKRNISSWNAIIAGSVQNGNSDKALQVLKQMQSLSINPNYVTILSILPAFANLLSVKRVREVHGYILRFGLHSEVVLANSLIDTYSKSGDIKSARAVFDLMTYRDVISWNSILAGYVFHGQAELAIVLFDQMMENGVKPNHITFTSMLTAYGILGMVTVGVELFSRMNEDYSSTTIEHFAAMVSLYGRTNRLREADDLIGRIDGEPNSAVWNALFTSCRMHGNVRLAILAVEKLMELQPGNSINCRILDQLYTMDGRSEEASRLGKPVSSLGSSLIEVNHAVYTFITGDQCTEWFEPMNTTLDTLTHEKAARKNDSEFRGLQVEEEEGENIVGIHSERLAVALGLMNLKESAQPIRVVKNLRVCLCCHNHIKLLSKVYRREIFLKDPNCLHHFKNGNCSCRDYW